MNLLLRITLTLCLFFLCCWEVNAQQNSTLKTLEDVVYKTDGSTLRGKIIVQNDETVTIQILGGSRFVIPLTEISKVTQEKPLQRVVARTLRPRKETTYKEKGYYNISEFSLLVGDFGTFGLHTVHGYQFDQRLAVGGGVGLTFWEQGYTLPLFVDVRGDLLKNTPVTPHFYAQGGYGIPLSKAERYLGWTNGNITNDKAIGGPLYGLGVGIRIHTPSHISWLISAGFNHETIELQYQEQWWREDTPRNVVQTFTHNRIALRLGIMF